MDVSTVVVLARLISAGFVCQPADSDFSTAVALPRLLSGGFIYGPADFDLLVAVVLARTNEHSLTCVIYSYSSPCSGTSNNWSFETGLLVLWHLAGYLLSHWGRSHVKMRKMWKLLLLIFLFIVFTVHHLSLSVVTSSIKLISVTAVDYPTAQYSLTCTYIYIH